MKPPSNFANQYLGNFANRGVFDRKEVALLLQGSYITEDTAELLVQLCYEDPESEDSKIFLCHRATVPYNREELMNLKRIANILKEKSNNS